MRGDEMYKPVKCGVEDCDGHLIMAEDLGENWICDQCGVLHTESFDFRPTTKKILRIFWDTEKKDVVAVENLETFTKQEINDIRTDLTMRFKRQENLRKRKL